jgi:hypothetical protein
VGGGGRGGDGGGGGGGGGGGDGDGGGGGGGGGGDVTGGAAAGQVQPFRVWRTSLVESPHSDGAVLLEISLATWRPSHKHTQTTRNSPDRSFTYNGESDRIRHARTHFRYAHSRIIEKGSMQLELGGSLYVQTLQQPQQLGWGMI